MRKTQSSVLLWVLLAAASGQAQEPDCAPLFATGLKLLSPAELTQGKTKIQELTTEVKIPNEIRDRELIEHVQVLRQDPEAFLDFALDYPKMLLGSHMRNRDAVLNTKVFLEALKTRPISRMSARTAERYLKKLVERSKPSLYGSFPHTLNVPSTVAILRETLPQLSPAKQQEWMDKIIGAIEEPHPHDPQALKSKWAFDAGKPELAKVFFTRLLADAEIEVDPKIEILNGYAKSRQVTLNSSHAFSGAQDKGTHWEKVVSTHSFTNNKAAKPIIVEGPNGKTITLSRQISPKSIERIRRSAPKYDDMYRDGVKRGLFWPDAGFSAPEARDLMQEYIANFKEMGFRFSVSNIADFKEFVFERVKSGHVDYMLREGHYDPLEISVLQKGEIHLGTRTKAGKKQEVLVYMPSKGSRSRQDFIWNEMRGALEHREKSHALYHIDTKCSALDDLCAMTLEAATEHLHVIAPKGAAMTFTNDESNALRALVNGLIDEKTYPDIRKDMQRARNVSKKEPDGWWQDIDSQDLFAFEDSDEYLSKVKEAVAESSSRITIEVSP